jgi:hypothetical protein
MKIEDLKQMSKGELEGAKVIVITECLNCPSFHGTFSFSNCGRNNDVITELNKNGFSTKCELINISQLMEILEKKNAKKRYEGFNE